MKITDLKCAVIGNNPVVRIVTDDGIDGFGEVESFKQYLKNIPTPAQSTSKVVVYMLI